MTESTKIDYVSIVQDLRDEADLCRNETATDIADLLDDAASCIVAMKSQFTALRSDLAAAREALRYIVALMDEARPGMDQGAPAEATARKFVGAFKEAQEARQAAEDELIAWKYRAQVYCDVGNEQRTRANAAVERAQRAEALAERLGVQLYRMGVLTPDTKPYAAIAEGK